MKLPLVWVIRKGKRIAPAIDLSALPTAIQGLTLAELGRAVRSGVVSARRANVNYRIEEKR